MDLQAALVRAQDLNCQLKYDRVAVHTLDGQTGIVISRVPAACYHLHPKDDKFQEGAVCVFVTDEMDPGLFDLRLQNAIHAIEDNILSVYPEEREQRMALIRK